jgi:hypothetical protein
MIGHCPRRSNLCASTLWIVTRWRNRLAQGGCAIRGGRRELVLVVMIANLQAGNLKASPLVSTAQAMRAFFAAIATAAFQ